MAVKEQVIWKVQFIDAKSSCIYELIFYMLLKPTSEMLYPIRRVGEIGLSSGKPNSLTRADGP